MHNSNDSSTAIKDNAFSRMANVLSKYQNRKVKNEFNLETQGISHKNMYCNNTYLLKVRAKSTGTGS